VVWAEIIRIRPCAHVRAAESSAQRDSDAVPADRLMDEVVRIVQEQSGDCQRRAVLACFDVVKCRENGDPSIPERVGPRKPLQQVPVRLAEMCADDVFGGGVDEIPVVDAAAVPKVRAVNRGTPQHVAALILSNQNQKREQPFLVPGRFQ